MNTPITDAAWQDYLRRGQAGEALASPMMRLELDRAALMESLVDCMAWTHRAIDLEVSGSMQIAQKGAIERAESALATARANFPES